MPFEPGPLGVYIHVPYCRVACPYCDFVKKPVESGAPDAFTEAVCREIAAYDGPRAAASIFFGGGTPSLLSPDSMTRILKTVGEHFDLGQPEISIEVNPDDVTEDAATSWRAAGITRVSLGVQSFNDEVLNYLGRCHDAATARRACGIVARHFENWGIDLIFGARPADAWEGSLAETVRFSPPHVSTYSLTFEPNTPFWRRRTEAIDEDKSLAQYRAGIAGLADYDHYEVSNFALPGFDSRHNRIYWRNEGYVGFGPGAYSFLDGARLRNSPRINAYLDHPGEKSEVLPLSEREQRIETLIQHFRTRSGIERAYYRTRFETEIDDDFRSAIRTLAKRKLIALEDDRYVPTRRGYELNDDIGLALVD